MTNPDYPTNTGSFLMHTYQTPTQTQSSFYYNGMGSVMPNMMPGGFQQDSRRNEPVPASMMNQANANMVPNSQNPLAAFQALYAQQNGTQMPTQYQQIPTSPISVPVEPNVQPFSSYPPEYRQPQNQFAVTADSRRFDMSTQTPTPSPWAQPVQNPFIMNAQNCPTTPQYVNPTADCGAMYADCNASPVFRRLQQWDNTYTQPQQIPMPVADWTQYIPNNTPQNGPVYAPPVVNPGVPDNTAQSWNDIARQNFK